MSAEEFSAQGDVPGLAARLDGRVLVATTLTADEVAALLRMSRSTFQARRRALEASGFPRPLPSAGLRWSPYAIEQWLRSNGGQDAPIAAEDPVLAARAALEARLDGRAA